MKEVADLLERMRKLEPEVHTYGPSSEEAIRKLEAAFGHVMPPTYRAFLVQFGAVSIVDSVCSGIMAGQIEGRKGCALTDTLRDRQRWQLPPHYLVIDPDEDGPTCLDFSRQGADGECPVVYYMPFRSAADVLAPSYGAWLTDALQCMVQAWDDGE
jgi:hypothetical protein